MNNLHNVIILSDNLNNCSLIKHFEKNQTNSYHDQLPVLHNKIKQLSNHALTSPTKILMSLKQLPNIMQLKTSPTKILFNKYQFNSTNSLTSPSKLQSPSKKTIKIYQLITINLIKIYLILMFLIFRTMMTN